MTARPVNGTPILSVLLRSALAESGGATLDSAAAALGGAGLSPCSRSHVDRLAHGDTPLSAAELEVLVAHLGLASVATAAARLAGGVFVPASSPEGTAEEARAALAALGRLVDLFGCRQ